MKREKISKHMGSFEKEPESVPIPEKAESVSFELNGKAIEMYGVFHGQRKMGLETFERYRERLEKATHDAPAIIAEMGLETLGRYHKRLEKAIHNASAVIVEAAPTAEGVYSSEVIEAIRDWIKRQDIVASDEEITQFIHSLQGNAHLKFYAEIEKVVAREGRPLITVDPRLAQNTMRGKFKEREEDVALAKKIGAIGGSGLFLSLALYDFVRGQQEKAREADNEEKLDKVPQKMSRRKFLKTTTKAIVGLSSLLALGSLIAEKHEPEGSIRTQGGRTKNPAGPFLYDLMDFRDVTVAQGLHMASKKNFGDGPIVLIYGSAHLNTIQHYSQRDTEREIKYQSYLPYREVDPPAFRVYHWSEENNWLKEEESNIQ